MANLSHLDASAALSELGCIDIQSIAGGEADECKDVDCHAVMPTYHPLTQHPGSRVRSVDVGFWYW